MQKTGSGMERPKTLAQAIADAEDIGSLMRVYNLIKFRAASAGKFNFASDFKAYKAYVENRVDELRRLTSARLSEAGECAKKKLGEKALGKAKRRYDRAHQSYAKKVVGGRADYPKHLMKIRQGVAYFTENVEEQSMLVQPSAAPFVEPEPKKKKKAVQPKPIAKKIQARPKVKRI